MITWSQLFIHLKTIAKKSDLLSRINAKLKCYQLKRDLAKLARGYNARAVEANLQYDVNSAIEEFKRRHQLYCSHFSPRTPGNLRVFWVGTVQSQDESGFLQALHRICTVSVFHNIKGTYGLLTSGACASEAITAANIIRANDEALLRQIEQARMDVGVDVLLGQMWAHLISMETLMEVRKMGIPVVNISMDDRLPVHWSSRDGVRLGSVGLASAIDMVLTTSSETCLWYQVEGCPAIFWPLASDPAVFSTSPGVVRDIDVLFIGNKYGVRGEIVRYIEDCGVTVDCYGGGWPNGYVNAAQMAALSKRARIILGVGTVGHCSDIYTLKLRDFDALMTGALYLTHRNPDLCLLFNEGEEIEYYDTPAEAYKKIRYYLSHPDDRNRVGLKGQRKVLSRDTWDERLASAFQQLGFIKSPGRDVI